MKAGRDAAGVGNEFPAEPESFADAGAAAAPDRSQIGRSDRDRRQGLDPRFGGPERRSGSERRKRS